MWETILALKDPVIFLVVGMFLLVKGADWFVEGSSNIAKLLKVPPLIIGLTLVSMGTSAPEASVSIQAAISGSNDISVGNVVGSNVLNVLFIVGMSAFFAPMMVEKEVKKFDLPIIIGASILLIIFSFVISPFVIDTVESIIMLVLFAVYLVTLIFRAKKNKPSNELLIEEEQEKPKVFKSIALAIVGLLAIIVGGDWVVDGASDIALMLGMDEILIGLTIVAVGTSLPELVTSIIAARKKENDIAIGNIIGSNIFNILFILGLSSTISNLSVSLPTLADMLVMAGAVIILFIFSLFKDKIGFKQGIVIFSIYILYLAFIIVRNYAF